MLLALLLASSLPQFTGYVVDEANVLDSSAVAHIKQVASSLDHAGIAQVAVCTVPDSALGDDSLEDYAVARLDFQNGAMANVACSWRLPAGQDAVIRGSIYGTAGGLAFENVAGSFYDFRAERFTGTSRAILDEPPDAWGGRAAVAWVEQLCESRDYDPAIEHAAAVAAVLDAIYGREVA